MLSSFALGALTIAATLHVFRSDHPHDVLFGWLVVPETLALALVVLAASVGLNLVVGRWFQQLALLNMLLSIPISVVLADHIVEWANVRFDTSSGRPLTLARGRNPQYRPS